MFEGKNYILSKENGNRVLLKKFIEYKVTGVGFFIGFLFLGALLIFEDFGGTRFYTYGIILICIGLFICILFLPLKIKVTEYKDEFIIEKVNSFWIKSRFKISKKENPKILGVKIMSLSGDRRYINNHLYNLRISYAGGEIKLHQSFVPNGYSHLSNPEQIKEIADFFKLPYKLID
jgi:hypothetical protein